MRRLILLLLCALCALSAGLVLAATDGPLTPLMNLATRTDENGYLRVSAGTPGATDGPLTPMANLRGCTEENGYLRVALAGGTMTGDLTTTGTLTGAILSASGAGVTIGTGTGLTVNVSAAVGTQIYKVTLARTAFTANAVTQDITLATLPAKTFLLGIIADKTTPFACTAVCTTATLSATVGKTAGQNEYLVSFDLDAAAAQYGDASGELGAALTEATIPTALGDLGSWASTQAVILRATSGTGNWGNGTVTNLSAGAMTFYLVTTRMP